MPVTPRSRTTPLRGALIRGQEQAGSLSWINAVILLLGAGHASLPALHEMEANARTTRIAPRQQSMIHADTGATMFV
jgi:hypothetical protein